MDFRRQFGYDVKTASEEARVIVPDNEFSLTIQSQAEDADINIMLKRFGVTGHMPIGVRTPEFGDYTEITDYRGALHAVMDAQDNFMKLDAEIRARFENDPQLFLNFAQDPANIDEMRKLGLAKAVAPATPPVPVPPA